MRIQEFSSRGGPGQFDKKSSNNVFFLVLSLFFRSQMVNFNEVPEGVQHFPGGVQLFPGGGGGPIAYSL